MVVVVAAGVIDRAPTHVADVGEDRSRKRRAFLVAA
jgi:hypothetical protein